MWLKTKQRQENTDKRFKAIIKISKVIFMKNIINVFYYNFEHITT